MWTRTVVICVLALTGLWASHLAAEVPNRTAEQLRQRATHVVTGDVVRIYERSVREGPRATTQYVAEIRVSSVEKGEGITSDSLIYVRYSTFIDPPGTTGTSGHRGLPKEGDIMRIYLARNANDGLGDGNDDGGLNVLFPNGFQPIAQEPSKKAN